ncbi:hypothetical protein EDD85DRAFT_775230 [Armillaria nabsnona]|nr:hypothetical protein EDD85DRAFT_775230 [Armillaria nabsnona]
MLDNKGVGRGSYIFGRSVHNTRIERLWYEVTRDFGIKWKNFFLDLEVHHGLDPKNLDHIWLIHYLWLAAINQDAQEWTEVWNNHKMNLPRSSPRTPREMFVTSMILDGPRGIDEYVEDPDSYGIDWEVVDSTRIREHLLLHNPGEWDGNNPFGRAPPQVSHVPCDPPNCPLTAESLEILGDVLSQRVDVTSRRMEVRRLVWQEAMSLCEYLLQNQN